MLVALPSSFRDPDGYVFEQDRRVFRLIRPSYMDSYNHLMTSGCYEQLVAKGLLLPHVDCTDQFEELAPGEKVLLPEQISCMTYPYEWSFSQLRAAALCTLDVLRVALEHGLTLKDASAYNITWHQGRAIFIDSLSFTPYQAGEPWSGYRQFCTHFLAPLLLQCYTDLRCTSLLLKFIDGIPLDLTSTLLPLRTKFNPSIVLHIHAHAKLQNRYSNTAKKVQPKVSKVTVLNLLESLYSLVARLKLPRQKTEWGDYYSDTNYSKEQATHKGEVINHWVELIAPKRLLDLGSNDGTYSRIAAKYTNLVLSVDMDPIAVESNVQRCIKEKNTSLLPIIADIATPSPAIGWNGAERASLFERMQCDCGMALALVHHLAIGNNLPLLNIFIVFRRLCPVWIVEFVDKQDSQVQRLLRNRPDIFLNYTQKDFEEAASCLFTIAERCPLEGTHRTLYLLRAKEGL